MEGEEEIMSRTTATKVKQIIETDLSDVIVEGYITGANSTVTSVLGNDTTVSDLQKEEIERWLTAHMIASTRQRQLEKGEAGSASATYGGKFGMGLDSTLFGQNVKAMDHTGKLASLGRRQASLFSVEDTANE